VTLSDADADRRRDAGLQQRRGGADASAVTASGNIVIAVPGVFASQRHSGRITTWYDKSGFDLAGKLLYVVRLSSSPQRFPSL